MRAITVIVTFDNARHDSQRSALKYLEVAHANKLSDIAAKVIQHGNGKHIATGNWIDDNLHLFAELQRIKADMAMVGDEEDDGQ